MFSLSGQWLPNVDVFSVRKSLHSNSLQFRAYGDLLELSA